MKRLINEYGMIFLFQLIIAYALYVKMGRVITPRYIIIFICYLVLLAFLIYLKERLERMKAAKNYRAEDGKIIIRGIFKTITLKRGEIAKFEIRANFVCRVFDWHLVVITKGSEQIQLYTATKPIDYSFLS